VAATGQNPPKREVGSGVANSARVYWPGSGVPGWSAFTADEHVPELKGAQEISTYDEMLTNPQLWALFIGLLLPCMEYDVGLEAGDADPAMTEVLAADLGLPVGLPTAGDTAPPLAPGTFDFNFSEHMWEALFALAYGRYYFEQVGEVIPDDGLWHLRRLAPRPPHDISDILTDDDGGLRAIMFPGLDRRGSRPMMREVPIPVTQLVGYVWMPTARRRWVGRSMMRPCYEPWVLRGRAVRIDIINHEKAGGIPFVETDETWQGTSLSELRDLASEMTVGQESGAALPPGAHLKLARVGGTDVIASVRYHDEAMARAWGEMVRQLGQTQTGSRALGGTMADLEAVMRRAVMRWFAAAFRQYVIRDWWLWNVGPTPHPSLAWRPRDDGQVPGDPGLGASGGGSPPDPTVARPASALAGRRGDAARRDTIGSSEPLGHPPTRRRGETGEGGVPRLGSEPASDSGGREPRSSSQPDRPSLAQDSHGNRSQGERGAVAATSRLPTRPLRRQPYGHEIAAATDFAALDLTYQGAVADTEAMLANEWLPQLHQAAEDAITLTRRGTERQRLTRLNASQITLPAPPVEPLQAILGQAAREAADGAVAELGAQGVAVAGLDDVAGLVADQARSVAQMVADGVRLAAARKAVQVNAGRSIAEVAQEVRSYLDGLVHQWERDQLRGAVQAAQNAARLAVFGQVPEDEPAGWYSSEILDVATCGPCMEVDGRAFATLAEAQRFYSFGGFNDCLGGPRCRGTVVAVMREG
jgi:hypothetical protein